MASLYDEMASVIQWSRMKALSEVVRKAAKVTDIEKLEQRFCSRLRGECGKYFAIEIRVRLPGLSCDEPTVADGSLVYENAAGLFGFEADVFVAGEALAFCEVRSRQNLNSVANGEYPFVLGIELADYIE